MSLVTDSGGPPDLPGDSAPSGASSHAGDPASLGQLLDLAPVGAIMRALGPDTIVYWSRGAEDLYGWAAPDALGSVTHNLLRTEFPESKDAVDAALREVGHWSGELVHTRRDGLRVVVASRQVLQRNQHGQPVAILELNTDITDHRRLEESLRDTEQQFQLLVSNVRDYAIVFLSTDGEVLSWNEGAERLKGYQAHEIIGQSFSRFYTPEARAEDLPARLLARAAAQGSVHDEGWRVRKDGSRFWADAVITALRDSSGKLRGFAKIIRDLSERRQADEARERASRQEGARAAAEDAEATVRASRDQLAAILRGVAEGITAMDPSGKLVFANDEAAHLCGLANADELLAVRGDQILSRFELFDEAGAPFPPERLPSRLVLAGQPATETLVNFRTRATGQDRWSVVNATGILDDRGQVALAVSIFRDVTERKLAEDRNRFLAAVNLELTRTLDYEQTLQRLAQLTVPRLADWCLVDVLNDGRLQRVAAARADTSDSEPPPLVDANRVIESGKPHVLPKALSVPLVARGRSLGAITLVSTRSGRTYTERDLATADDLAVRAALALDNARLFRESQQQTESHVQLNAALRDTMDQLQQALSARDEFLASVSHDLKNPIASIKGMAQLLERRLTRSRSITREHIEETLRTIDAVATRASGQVEELLDIARMRLDQPLDLDREPTDLVALAGEVVTEYRHRGDGREIRFHPDIPSLVGNWDNRRLSRALGNLIENALKYSAGDSPIDVRVALKANGVGWAVLTVEDRGVGIPPADLEHIFERFKRGANVLGRISGTGIGLASVQQIVQSHHGRVEAASQLGRGTTITVRLPITQPEDTA